MSLQNEPLVINIINSIGRGAKIIFDILATLIYLPLYYLFLMSTTFLKPTITNFFIFWITTPIRWIFGTISFPILIIWPISFSYLIYKISLRDGNSIAIISSISSLIISIVLLLRGHRTREEKDKIKVEFLFQKMISVQIEFLSFIFSIISIPLFTRISLLMKSLSKLKEPKDFHSLGFKIFLFSIFDYLTFIPIVIFLFFFLIFSIFFIFF